jgi:DNA-binding NarL/FixJ family response regulator
MQILEMVSRGLQNKAIAAEFNLSEHTVKIHLHNIISKLGIHNRTEAAARYRDHQAGRIRITGNSATEG